MSKMSLSASHANKFELFVRSLIQKHAASYLQDAIHILQTICTFAKTKFVPEEAPFRTARGEVMTLCGALLVKIKRDGNVELLRSVPECIKILGNRVAGSDLHLWNVANEVLGAAGDLLAEFPPPPPSPPSEKPKSKKSSRNSVPPS